MAILYNIKSRIQDIPTNGYRFNDGAQQDYLFFIVFGLPAFDGPTFDYRKHAEIKSGDTGYPRLHGYFSTGKFLQYRVGANPAGSYIVNVVQYLDEKKHAQRAMVYISDQSNKTSDFRVSQGSQIRYQAWQGAAEAIKKHTAENALFAAWWDNSQRIHFLSGRRVLSKKPVAGAFADQNERGSGPRLRAVFRKTTKRHPAWQDGFLRMRTRRSTTWRLSYRKKPNFIFLFA